MIPDVGHDGFNQRSVKFLYISRYQGVGVVHRAPCMRRDAMNSRTPHPYTARLYEGFEANSYPLHNMLVRTILHHLEPLIDQATKVQTMSNEC
jgi:hypothetical protein